MSILEILENSNEDEIRDFCTRRFQKNLNFFAQDYPNLFSALQNPPQEYSLSIDKSGINILNFKNNSFVYPKVEEKSLMLQVHKTCAFDPLNNEKWEKFFGADLAKMGDDFPFTSLFVDKILDFVADNGGLSSFHLPNDFLPSLSLFGLGGGIYLQVLVEKYKKIQSFIIYEESLDLFRIACFFIDFAELYAKTEQRAGFLFIESFMKRDYILQYFAQKRISTSAIRLELTMYQSPKNISAKALVKESHMQTLRCWGSFEDEMRGIKNKLSFPLDKMLIEPKRINAPICVVANGASLDSLLPFIKENQKNMIIFSCGTALKPLMYNGIKPDFQIEIERHDYLGKVLREAPLDDVPLLCASVLDIDAKQSAKEIYFFERDGSSAAMLNAPRFKVRFTAPLVGNAGVALACYLGSDVLLCGLDCGYVKGAKIHAQNSYYDEVQDEKLQDEFFVSGNFREEVCSDSLYSLSRTALEDTFSALKPHNILNLSDGALIKGARPTKADEFDLKKIDKKKELENLKSLFKNPKDSNFYQKDNLLHSIEAKAFSHKIGDLFNEEIRTKEELFAQVDKIFYEISTLSKTYPLFTILFGGSLSHYLYTILLCAMHFPKDDIKTIWDKAKEYYNHGMEKMLENFQTTILKK